MARQIAGRAAIEGFIGGDWTARLRPDQAATAA
jgi:hypothetical protein